MATPPSTPTKINPAPTSNVTIVTKNENISVTHFANQQFMDLLRRAARGIVRDEKLELYEKYALADAVATLAIVEGKFFNEPTRNGFHHRGL